MTRDSFIDIAMRKSVVRHASHIAIVVGIFLGLLNHRDAIFTASLTTIQLAKIYLTLLMPFSVST